MAQTPEGKVKARVKRILDAHGPGLWWYMPVQTGYGRAGIPDFIVCAWGRFIGIETKAGKNVPTAHQKRELARITGAQGIALVIREDNLTTLSGILATMQERDQLHRSRKEESPNDHT